MFTTQSHLIKSHFHIIVYYPDPGISHIHDARCAQQGGFLMSVEEAAPDDFITVLRLR